MSNTPYTARYRDEQRVEVYPFSRQVEGDEAVIGRPDLARFLVVPVDALELLDELAQGRTIGAVRETYRERHGEDPDIANLLEQLEARGLVWPEGEAPPEASAAANGESPERFRGHFQWIPRRFARALFGPVGLATVGVLATAALAACLAEPGIVPGWRALFFPERFATMVPVLVALHLLGIFLHEMGHLLAARAEGVPARLGIGHRLWIVVAETDMTGLWTLPRRRRYLPMVAGPIVDVATSSLLLLVLFAETRGLLALPTFVEILIPALLLRYLLGLIWQGYFFVRTDLYYVIANATGSKSLLADTEEYLKSLGERLLGRRPRDLSHIPPREMVTVRAYAVVWLLGRLAALSVLAFVVFPLASSYMGVMVESLDPRTGAPSFDALVMSALALLFLGLGMAMWVRTLLRKNRREPMTRSETLPVEPATSGSRTVVIEAAGGAARREHLDQWHRTLRDAGLEAWALDVDLDRGGPWAGTRDFLAELTDELSAEAPELVTRHDYELTTICPALRRRISVRNPTLTDEASGDERVRNYPIDRAYRLVHGVVDLLAAWRHEHRDDEPWVLLLDGYDRIGALNRRLFVDLLRRRAEQLALTLVVTVAPGEGDGVAEELRRWAPVERRELDLAAGEPGSPAPEEAARLATELEEKLGSDRTEKEIHFPTLIRLWQLAGRRERTLHWQVLALGICNHRGFYEDARHYVPPALEYLEGPDVPDDVRWNIVGNIFNTLTTTGEPEEAQRVVETEALGKIDDDRYRIRAYYVMAMLHVRYLPEHDVPLAARYLEDALEMLEVVDLPEEDRHFQIVFMSNGLALVRHRQKRPEEAVELCRRGFERLEEHLGPERHRLHRSVLLYNIAQVYTAVGDDEQAIAHYGGAMAMDPNYSEYYNERGNVYLRRGEYERAAMDYQKAVELSPPYPEVWTNLGQCYRLTGHHREAVQALTRSLDLEPDQDLALSARAQSHEALGDTDAALADYSAALELDPDQALLLANRAVLHYEKGDLEASLADLDRAIELAPETAELYQNRAVALKELERPADAARDLERYLELAPEAADRADVEAQLATLGGERSDGVGATVA